MRYIGEMKCHACVEGDHRNCAPFDLVDEETGAYAACSCECQEATEAAGYREDRDVVEARRNEFFATINALAKAQSKSLGGA